MRNGNLLQYLKSNPGSDRKRLILQVASALDHLHNVEDIVHGDIKCTNVLISDQGEALLSDFGLCTSAEKTESTSATATSIHRMYTPRFAAPEVLFGPDCPSARHPGKTYESDVYAFGMLILEALTEQQPWNGLPDTSVMLMVWSGNIPSQPGKEGGFPLVSHAWWDICRRCWRFSPGDRPTMHKTIRLLQDKDIFPQRALLHHTSAVLSVAYVRQGDGVVLGSEDGSISICDLATGSVVGGLCLRHSRGCVASVAVSPDGLQIASAGADCTIRRWDVGSALPIGTPMTGHRNFPRCVAYSPDSRGIVSGGDDGTVRLWDARTGEPVGGPLQGHTHWVYSVAVSPDGACIASGSRDRTIRLWESATGAAIGLLEGHDGAVYSVCFSPDGTRLISGSRDQTVRVWNLRTRRPELTLRGHSHGVNSVAVSPSGAYIASGAADGTIRVWNGSTGALVGEPLTGHRSWVFSVAFSPDGRSLVSASDNGMVRIWDLFE